MLLLFVLVTNNDSVNRILRIRAFRPIPSPPVSTYPSPVLTVRMPLRSDYLVRLIPWSEWLVRTLYCLIMHDSPTKFVFPFSRLRALSFRLRFLRYYLFLPFRRTYTWLLFLLNPLDSPPFSFLTTLYHNIFCLSYSIIKKLQKNLFCYCMKKARRGLMSRFFRNSLGFVLGYTIHSEKNGNKRERR